LCASTRCSVTKRSSPTFCCSLCGYGAKDCTARGAMTIWHEPPSLGEEVVAAGDVELAERRVAQARERAPHAGPSAALRRVGTLSPTICKGARPGRPTRRIRSGRTPQLRNPPSASSSRRPRPGRAKAERVRSRPVSRHEPLAAPAQLVSRTGGDVARCIAAQFVPDGR